MKRSWRYCAGFALFALLFVCLLFSRGRRLIGGIEQECCSDYSVYPAYISALPQQTAQEQNAVAFCSVKPERKVCIASDSIVLFSYHAPACDSNGNILRTQGYLHAVYHAFDLSDGFA